MTPPQYPVPVTEGYVQANGLTIWYVEAGQGIPLLLLHGGPSSNGPLWVDHEWGWGAHLGTFAPHFRVIAPDTRGHGRTLNPSGVHSFATYAEDVLALAQALHLDHPLVCGFSDGGHTAALVGILAPDMPRAIVNLGGYVLFDPNPEHPIRVALREELGGNPHATRADVVKHYDQAIRQNPDSALRQRLVADFETTQGVGYLHRYYEEIFEMWTTPMPYTLDDYRTITAPTLILVGDRDEFCSVEEGVQAYRHLPQDTAEFGVMPGVKHAITPLGCTVARDFFLRHSLPRTEEAPQT